MSRDAAIAFIGLGSNQGASLKILQTAVAAIAALPDSRCLQVSSLYASKAAEGAADGPDFLNAVLKLETHLSPVVLLQHLQVIENTAGRERHWRHAPRTLDLDILLYGDRQIDTVALQIPHPRMAQRAFVLKPLWEISPSLVSNQQLLQVASQMCEISDPDWLKTRAL